jgi:hypothetical protein
MLIPHRKHIYGPSGPVTDIALLYYVLIMFIPHRKHIYETSGPVTVIALLYYM